MKYYSGTVWNMSLHIVISSFLFCYTFGVFNQSAPNVSSTLDWGSMELTYTTLFSSFATYGALFGTLVAGSLMSRVGRRKSLMLADLVMIFSSLLFCIPFTVAFAIGRFVSGVAAGIFMTVPPSYVNEITPDEMLHKTGPLVQISINISLVFAFGFGLALPTSNYSSSSMNNWWIFMFTFPGLLSLYQFLYFLLYCKYDSPLWHHNQGQKEETLKSLSMIYSPEGLKDGQKRLSSTSHELKQSFLKENPKNLTFKDLFTDKSYRKMLRISIILALIQQFSGINAGVFYSTSIFMKISESVYLSRLYTLLVSIVFLLSSAAAVPLLKCFGRVNIIFSGTALLGINLCALGVFASMEGIPDIVNVGGILLIFIFFGYSLGSTLWMYLGEICVDKALGVSGTVNLVSICLITGVFPIVVENLGIEYAFFFFGACMVLGAVYCKVELIESRGKSKQELLEEVMRL